MLIILENSYLQKYVALRYIVNKINIAHYVITRQVNQLSYWGAVIAVDASYLGKLYFLGIVCMFSLVCGFHNPL